MHVISNITKLADIKGVSQAFICDKLGKRRNYLFNLKKQNKEPSEEQMVIIANVLGTTVAYLKGETDDPEPQKEKSPSNDGLAPDEQALLSIYRMTPSEKRLDFIRQLINLVPDEDQTELAVFVLEAIKTSK